jgi:hypothetical protein
MTAIWWRAAVFAVLCAAAALVFGPHVAHGALVEDDWAIADFYRHGDPGGYWGSVEAVRRVVGSRPLMWLAQPLPYAVFGAVDPAPYLLTGLAIGVLTAWCAFLFLEEAGLPWGHAAFAALLFLLWPWQSSLRLWPIVGWNEASFALVLLGGWVALRGLRRRGGAAVAWHAVAVALFVAAVLLYETATPIVLLSGAFYARVVGWRRAVAYWAVDALAVVAALAWASAATSRPRAGLLDSLDRLGRFVREAILLTARSLVPLPLPQGIRYVVAALAAGVVGAAIVAVRRAEPASPAAQELRSWLWAAALAAACAVAGWTLMLFSGYFFPLSRGIDDRANVGAALPIVVLVWSIVMLAVVLLRDRWVTQSRAVATMAVAGLALACAYGIGSRQRANTWDRAARDTEHLLTAVASLPPLPPGSTVYTFGAAGEVSPGVPVFQHLYDLNPAVRVTRGDPSLRGYPVLDGARMTCGARRLDTLLPGSGGRLDGPEDSTPVGKPYWGYDPGASYGRIAFVDLRTRSGVVVKSRRQCAAAVKRFQPGPLRLE